MCRIILSVFITCLLLKCATAEKPADGQPDSGRDSYLKAYTMTKKLNKKSDFNGFYPHDFHGYPDDGFDYGPPIPHYGPPKPIYGPPAPYPPPHYRPYPPPPPPAPEPVIPHALLGILDKIKYKIDLLTIGKIILKLLIFKKIVAWIGVICLLLFIPSLKNKHFFLNNNNNHMGEDDLLRSYNSRNSDVDDRINNLGNFVMDSIGTFSHKSQNESNCQSIYCKSQRFQKYIDEKLTFGKLAGLYAKEL
ncbi:putative transferrins [Trypoxylus dichotomus]